MKKIIICFLIITTFSFGQDRITGKDFATRSEVIAQNGMACTSQPLATQAAIDILKQGGNAIDAAIAANAVNTVVEPMSCGIGGDLFAILWHHDSQKLFGLNASGRSPKSLTLEMLKDKGLEKIPIRGSLSVSVPGCVDGWFELHNRFGSLSINKILEPAIHYAQNGFPVTEIIAEYWQKGAEELKDQPGFAKIYMPNGKTPLKGEIFKNPALAKILKLIAKDGKDAFYNGFVAKEIKSFLKQHGGYLTSSDLQTHTSEWIEPVSTNYRGYDVWELPPNGQGIAALQILNIIEGFDIKKMGFGSKEYLHNLIEAKKLAYEDRAKFYADPEFNQIPVEKLISKKYALDRRKLINQSVAAKNVESGDLEDGDTIYLTVADKDGNMISLIQS